MVEVIGLSAFITSSGRFLYAVIAFSLCNSAFVFQQLMNIVVDAINDCAVGLNNGSFVTHFCIL